MSLSVLDYHVPKTAAYYAVEKGGALVSDGDFCDSTTISLPTGKNVIVFVYVYESAAPAVCPGALPGVEGEIRALFTS